MKTKDIQLYDLVEVFGHGDEIRNDKYRDWTGYFNGVLMQVIDLNTIAGHTTAVCVEIDVNDDYSVRFFSFHVMQLYKITTFEESIEKALNATDDEIKITYTLTEEKKRWALMDELKRKIEILESRASQFESTVAATIQARDEMAAWARNACYLLDIELEPFVKAAKSWMMPHDRSQKIYLELGELVKNFPEEKRK